MDVLRHAGRGQLSSFAGGSNAAMDAEQWEVAPYTEVDLERQADSARGRRRTSCGATPRTTSPASTSTSPRRGWTRARCRASTSPIDRPQGPDPWTPDRPDRDRLAGRRDLRQGRRPRARVVERRRRARAPLRPAARRARPSATSARPRTRRRRSPSCAVASRTRSRPSGRAAWPARTRARSSRTRPTPRPARPPRRRRAAPAAARGRCSGRSRSRARRPTRCWSRPPAPRAGGR